MMAPRSPLARVPAQTCSLKPIPARAGEPLPPPTPKRAPPAVAAALAAALAFTPFTPPSAAASDRVGSFTANGLVFKDSVEVSAVADPAVSGVTVYVADFRRSLADKLATDFFSEPGQASVTCAATGPLAITDLASVTAGGEVFSERRGLSLVQNKTLRVRRLFDKERRTLLYVAYATRLAPGGDGADAEGAGSRYRTSICAVPLPAAGVPGLDDVAQGGRE